MFFYEVGPLIKLFWIPVAQKARDEFDEAERALRAVDDQIKWVVLDEYGWSGFP